MATYRKLLKNRAGDTIIPVVDVINYLYPVGSIYMSATMSTVGQVQAAFGGTWVKWGAGRVPVGVNTSETEFNTVEKTGGEKKHTLTVAEAPINEFQSAGGAGDWTYLAANASGVTPHNNLQPYITCYMYKRTA